MITFQEERIESCADGVKALVNEAWEEIRHGPFAGEQPDPDYDKYQQMENIGALSISTVRVDGKIVGYGVLLILPTMHNKGKIKAFVNSMYLQPAHRKGLVGYKFLRFIEKQASTRVGKNIEWGVTVMRDFAPILERMGYVLQSYIFGPPVEKNA